MALRDTDRADTTRDVVCEEGVERSKKFRKTSSEGVNEILNRIHIDIITREKVRTRAELRLEFTSLRTRVDILFHMSETGSKGMDLSEGLAVAH